jgi:hypothetical protein
MRQLVGAGVLLSAALAAVIATDPAVLAALAAGAVLTNLAMARRLASGLRRLGGAVHPRLALRTVAVFAFVVPAARLILWEELLTSRRPGSALFRIALFLLLVRHFARVLAGEAWRLLTAQNLAAPRRWRHGWWGSLVWALAALFRRALLRAERFYAAQLVRGLGP